MGKLRPRVFHMGTKPVLEPSDSVVIHKIGSHLKDKHSPRPAPLSGPVLVIVMSIQWGSPS